MSDNATNMARALARIREVADFDAKDNTPELMGRLETIWQIANGEQPPSDLPSIREAYREVIDAIKVTVDGFAGDYAAMEKLRRLDALFRRQGTARFCSEKDA